MALHAVIQAGTLQNSGNQSAPGTSWSFSHTCEDQAARVVVICIGARHTTAAGNTQVTAVSYGAVSCTFVGDGVNGGAGTTAVRSSVWICTTPVVGVNTVSVTMNAGPSQAMGTACTYWNVDQSTAQDVAANTDNGATANEALSITTATDRALCIGSFMMNNNTGVAAASGQTELFDDGDGANYELAVYNLAVLSPGSTPNNLTNGAAKWGYVIMALRPRRRKIRVA